MATKNIINKWLSTQIEAEEQPGHLGGNGWVKLPNGLIIQWCNRRGGVYDKKKQSFPIAFNQIYSCVSSGTSDGEWNGDWNLYYNNTQWWGQYASTLNVIAVGR